MGMGNGIFWSEIGSGFGDAGGTPPPKILRSTPPGRLPPSKSYKSKKPGPSPIIVKFVRRDTKGAFYQARLKLKEMTSKDLGFPDEHRMYISESLSPTNRELFNEAYKLKKDLDYKFLWTSNGKVFLGAPEVSPVIFINSLDLVKKIRNQNIRSGPERLEALSLQCRRYFGAEYGTLDKSLRCRHLGL